MTSMLCDKQPGGTVGVLDKNKVEELIIDSEDHIQTMFLDKTEPFLQRKKIRRPYSTPNPGYRGTMTSTNTVDPDALVDHSLKLQDWLNEKSIKNIQEKSDLDTKSTRKLYDDMLSVEDNFVKEMEDLVNYKEFLDLRKKELLHKRWTERVYQPIRRQVVNETRSREFGELFQRKRQLYKEYLEHVNKKGHVFLETFDPAEYYPMAINPVRPGSLIAQTRRLRDPLLSQQRDRCNEDRVMFKCQIGSHLSDSDIEQIRLPPLPLVPLGRHGTEPTTWIAMPMGDIESPMRLASRRRIRPRSCQSRIHNGRSFLSPTDMKPISEELEVQGNNPSAVGPLSPEIKCTPVSTNRILTSSPEQGDNKVKMVEMTFNHLEIGSEVPEQQLTSQTKSRPLQQNVPTFLGTSPVINSQSIAVQTSC